MVDKAELKAMSRKELEKLLNEVKKALATAKARDHREAKRPLPKQLPSLAFRWVTLQSQQARHLQRRKEKQKPRKNHQNQPLQTRLTSPRLGREKAGSPTGTATRLPQAPRQRQCASLTDKDLALAAARALQHYTSHILALRPCLRH
mgnify:CR=1 FL=1